eukprot:s1039_g6.t1
MTTITITLIVFETPNPLPKTVRRGGSAGTVGPGQGCSSARELMSKRPATRRGIVVSSYALKGPQNDALFYEHLLRSFGFRDVRTLSDVHLGRPVLRFS